MELKFPHFVQYEVKNPVSLEDVIATLEANQRFFLDLPDFLENLVSGLEVQKVDIKVGKITQDSLRELLIVTIVVTFQNDLKAEIRALLEKWFNVSITEEYDTLITVLILVPILYGADYLFKLSLKKLEPSKITAQLDALIKELALSLNKTEIEVRTVLNETFRKPSRIKQLAKASQKFFRPSKRESNNEIKFADRIILSDVVAEVPLNTELSDEPDLSETFENVEVEIYAKDRDRDASGWAGLVKGVTAKRIKMKLAPPVKPEHVWDKDKFMADVLLISKQDDGVLIPQVFYVLNVKNEKKDSVKARATSKSKK